MASSGADRSTEEGMSKVVSLFHDHYPSSQAPEEYEKDGTTLFRPPEDKTSSICDGQSSK